MHVAQKYKILAPKSDRIILGIDPGTNIMGYGLIQIKGNHISLINIGVIHLNKLNSHADKLKKIFERTIHLIDEYNPDEMSLEAPFFGKNVQSMLKLGRAQGVCMATALSKKIPVFEYSPRLVKQSIVGNGNASKEQVSGMLQAMFPGIEHNYLDAFDALAVAACHHSQTTGISAPKHGSGATKSKSKKAQSSSWDQFIQQNPERLK